MFLVKYIFTLTSFSIILALGSIFYEAFISLNLLKKSAMILTGLLAFENIKLNRSEKPTVAIGYGACTDLLINATEFLNYSSDIFPFSLNFKVDQITNEKELLQSFAFYFKSGAAAERFMPNHALFNQLIMKVKTHHKGKINWSFGGNAPMMASRFQIEGCNVLLGARMSKKLRKHISGEIEIAGETIENDDVHLILEYNNGDRWGPFIASRANRYILHSDVENPYLTSVDQFHQKLSVFQPNLIVISGLQMLDSFKFLPYEREMLLEKVKDQMSLQSLSVRTHFEMASFVEMEMMDMLQSKIFPIFESFGMNEQELALLSHYLQFKNMTFITDSIPRVANTLDNMRNVFRILTEQYYQNNISSNPGIRRPTRLHIHTLAFQTLLIVHGSPWPNSKSSVAKASLTAYRYVCNSSMVNPESALLLMDSSFVTSKNRHLYDKNIPQRIIIDPLNPVSCWNETMKISTNIITYEICIAPVLVCRVAKKTAGAGDNISAAALSKQI